MGPPVDKVDRDDHTHTRERQGEGEESQSEVSAHTPPPISRKKIKKYKKRYFTVPLCVIGPLALSMLAHIGEMLQQSRCLSFVLSLFFQMTLDQPHQLQIRQWYVTTPMQKCIISVSATTVI